MFKFQQFSVDDSGCAMKVGTDSVLLGAWTDVEGVHNVADFGAGSALLSLMIAQRVTSAKITAIEIDAFACRAAETNVAASPWSDNIKVVNADVMDYKLNAPVDLIITNPPYFNGGLLSPDAARATARTAGSFGPLAAIGIAAKYLSAQGSLAMIVPTDMTDDIIFEAEMHRMQPWRQCEISQVEGRKPTRTLWQIVRKSAGRTILKSSLTIRNASALTPEFVKLTRNFYL